MADAPRTIKTTSGTFAVDNLPRIALHNGDVVHIVTGYTAHPNRKRGEALYMPKLACGSHKRRAAATYPSPIAREDEGYDGQPPRTCERCLAARSNR